MASMLGMRKWIPMDWHKSRHFLVSLNVSFRQVRAHQEQNSPWPWHHRSIYSAKPGNIHIVAAVMTEQGYCIIEPWGRTFALQLYPLRAQRILWAEPKKRATSWIKGIVGYDTCVGLVARLRKRILGVAIIVSFYLLKRHYLVSYS